MLREDGLPLLAQGRFLHYPLSSHDMFIFALKMMSLEVCYFPSEVRLISSEMCDLPC